MLVRKHCLVILRFTTNLTTLTMKYTLVLLVLLDMVTNKPNITLLT